MKHYGFGRRLLAAFCTIILLVMMMPVGVFAAVDGETSDGDISGNESLVEPVALDGEGETYTLTIPQDVENGTLTVTVDDTPVSGAEVKVSVGATVVVTAVPVQGFRVNEFVAAAHGMTDNCLDDQTSPGTFAMPASNVTLFVSFEERGSVNVTFNLCNGLKEKSDAIAYTDEDYETRLEAEYGYELPESIAVEIDGTELNAGDYTWADGTLTIASDKLTDNETVTVTAAGTELPYVSVTAKLTNLKGESISKVYPSLLSDAYTYTITPSSGYELPESIAVEIDGTELNAGDYTWAAGALTIASDKLTDNETVTVTAVGVPIEYTVTIDISKVNVESIYKNGDESKNILNDESTTKEGKKVTFKATIEDTVVVNLKADRFYSVPDAVPMTGGTAGTEYSPDSDPNWIQYYNIATLTFKKGSIDRNIDVLWSGNSAQNVNLIFKTYRLGLPEPQDINEGYKTSCSVSEDYSINFNAWSGYTLPATITVKSGDTPLEDVTGNSEATAGYIWTGGTLTILQASLQAAVDNGNEITVEATAALKNDNLNSGDFKQDTVDKAGNVTAVNWNDAAILIKPDGPATMIAVDGDKYYGIIVGTNAENVGEGGIKYYTAIKDCKSKEITFKLYDGTVYSEEKTLYVSVDTTSPVVTVSGYSIDSYSDTNSKHYTSGTITVTFDVEEDYFKLGDDPLGSYEVQINGTKTTEGITWSEDGKHCTVTLNCEDDTQELDNELADGEYTVTLSVTDSAQHSASADSEPLVLDKTDPVVAVSGYSIESYSDTNSKHYTNDTITVTFDVEEDYFKLGDDPLGSYEVRINDAKTTEGITWSEDGKHCTVTLNCANDAQELDNELADGEYTVTLSVTDAAGNNQSATSETLVLDATAPTGEVTKYTTVNGEPKYAYSDEDNKRYVGDFVTITFKVTEKNFDPANFSFESLPDAGVTLGDWKTDPLSDTIQTIELTLEAGEAPDGVYDNIKLNITDMAGNVVSKDRPIKSDPIVLDATKPTIEKIEYSEKANSRLSQLLKNIWWWIVGKTNADNNEGELRKVKATVTVSDNLSPIDSSLVEPSEKIKNLQIVDRREASESKTEKGTYNGGYEATFTFEATAQFMEELAISAADAAGNESDALDTTMGENGVVAASPNLLIDTYAPTIDFDTIDYGTVHNSDYSVGIHISDPKVDDVYSGLKEVRVSVHYQQSAITTSAAAVPGYAGDAVDGEYVYTKTFASSAYVQGEDATVTIPVALHSNLVYVEVTAVDNAGNSKTVTTKDSGWYIKMDNVLPVISVVYDNNSAQNNKYFKDTRTATITVEDNNFDAAGMTLNTRGSLGTWTATGQTNADGQNYVYTCAVSYVPDADYTLSITGTDMAGNTTSDAGVSYANQTAPQEFTVDRTVPTFTISMANADVDVASGGYSNQDVIVTLSVTEHNFDANAATAGLTVLYEGNDISQSIRSGLSWSNNGDVHTATFTLKDDGEYKIALSFLDLAGNSTAAAEDVVVHVDQTNAMVYVTGVADQSANAQKEIVPVVTVWDKYYNEDGVVITLINGEGKNVTDKYLDMENGRSEVRYDEQKDLYYQTFTFQNITEDHVYYLEVRHTDLAGNVNSEMTVLDSEGKEKPLDLEKGRMRFSVNRNGSTYSAGEETLAILGCYVQMAKNVRILEINVDELDPESIHITLTHDNVTRDLTCGEDYTYQAPPEQNDASWNVYEYVLSDSLFAEDGVYTISIYSVDAAGNVAQNNTEEKDFEITFVVDKTPPIFVALDLESGAIYNEEQHTATINCSDNIAFDTVHVYCLDSTAEKDESGNYIWFREKADGEVEMLCEEIELTAVEGTDGDYTFVLYEGDSAATSKQSVLVVCTDKAGNQNLEQEILDFTVSSSFWIRFYANKPLFYGSIGGICALLIVAAVVFLRKKKDDERA